ncbi:MAG: pilus assembly protein PilM [Oscillospiraceae bacterium]|nr:pilus assembly protein PilM [Oscillospiraceae bacterium]
MQEKSKIEEQILSEQERKGLVFAVDIGTRSVIGIVGTNYEDGFEILDYEQVHHQARAMRDGQIEDIERVADAIAKVKTVLERRTDTVFTKVAVAAAGRALKTSYALYEQELDENEIITKQKIHSFEYSAVSIAQEKFFEANSQNAKENAEDNFYCVGYSVVSYKLDGYAFANLEGHKGKSVSVELIAAFLPDNVARSLYTVTSMNGLDVDNLTLEPIAAINVIVPRDIRLLNIAIADIGAGTSDIAISKNGSITAYGMVTIAGDEITETIMHTYLTDFNTAEEIKIAYSGGAKEVSFNDILGFERVLKAEEISAALNSVIDTLCKTISDEILRINETAPVAVFLVGGGSQISGLCERVADNLGLAHDRVSVGGRKPFKHTKLCSDSLLNPEFVTPIGIGVVSSLYKGCNFFSVTVNNRKVMLLGRDSITVMDALLLAGIKPSKLIGLFSQSVSFAVNGKKESKRGNAPQTGKLTVNGQDAPVDMFVKQGDAIVALPAENGAPVEVRLSEIAEKYNSQTFVFEGSQVTILPEFYVGGKKQLQDYIINDGDSITVEYIKTLGELISCLKKDSSLQYTINGEYADHDSLVYSGDSINIQTAKPEKIDQEEQIQPPEKTVELNVFLNGKPIKIPAAPEEPVMFVELLNFTDIDTKKEEKGELILRINGNNASYTDEIREGDQAEIRWEG